MGLQMREGEEKEKKKSHIEEGSINSYLVDILSNSGMDGKF